MARIKSNAAKLLQLDVQQNSISLHMCNAPKTTQQPNTKKRKLPRATTEPQRKQPSRTSARLQGSAEHLKADTENIAVGHNDTQSSGSGNACCFCKAPVKHAARTYAALFVDRRNLLTQQEYMALTGKGEPAAFTTDGHFKGYTSALSSFSERLCCTAKCTAHSAKTLCHVPSLCCRRYIVVVPCRWVDPAICQQYGIADCASDAWNQNGGGKFSFKIDKSGTACSNTALCEH